MCQKFAARSARVFGAMVAHSRWSLSFLQIAAPSTFEHAQLFLGKKNVQQIISTRAEVRRNYDSLIRIFVNKMVFLILYLQWHQAECCALVFSSQGSHLCITGLNKLLFNIHKFHLIINVNKIKCIMLKVICFIHLRK